jgi:hypothetical protein
MRPLFTRSSRRGRRWVRRFGASSTASSCRANGAPALAGSGADYALGEAGLVPVDCREPNRLSRSHQKGAPMLKAMIVRIHPSSFRAMLPAS